MWPGPPRKPELVLEQTTYMQLTDTEPPLITSETPTQHRGNKRIGGEVKGRGMHGNH